MAAPSPVRRPGQAFRPFLWFFLANVVLCLFVFRGGIWGDALLAPLDILPAVLPKYRFVDPQSTGIPANHFIIDQVTYDLPVQTSIYRAYHSGEIPWWDPYNCSGRPLLAESHINGTEPIRVLAYLTLPFELAYNWTRILNYVFSGLAMLLLLRHWNFSGTLSLLLALAYEFAGGFVLHFGHPWIQAQFNYYPLIWLAWDAWFHRKSWWAFPLGIAAVGGAFNAGNLQSQAYIVIFAGAILLGYGGFSFANWKRMLPIVAVSGVLGLMLVGPPILNELQLFSLRTRVIALKVESNSIAGIGTFATFFPWSLGTFRTLDLGKFFNSSNMGFYLFAGSVAVIAAILAMRGMVRTELSPARRTAVWLMLAYLVIACSPFVNIFYTRSAGLGLLGLITLAALGLERLFADDLPKRRLGWFLAVGIGVVVVGVNVASLVVYPKFIPRIERVVQDKVARTSSGMQEAQALHEFQIHNFANEVSLKNPETLFAALGILLLAGVCLKPAWRRQRWALPALLILNLLPPVMFARRYIPVQPVALWQRLMASDTEPRRVADLLNAGHFRLAETYRISMERLYPNAMSHYFQVHNVHGYSSLQPYNFDVATSEMRERLKPQMADYFYESLVPQSPVGELKKNPTPGLARFQWPDGSARELRIERETMNSLVLAIGDGPAADLLRTDTWYPGWSATVGGQSVPVEKVEPFFSRMKIPAGPQTLTLHYTPTYLRLGVMLSLSSLVLTGLIAFGLRRRSRVS
ncbi:MAG: YfhO family protein [Verrucomicrobiota bacterium]